MRNIYELKQVFILIAISISVLFSIEAEAQENNRDFNSPAYQQAIDNITTLSGGEINADNINAYLNGTLPNGGRSTDDGETIIVSPVIDLVSYDGSEDAEYMITGIPDDKIITITSISYSPSQPSWITEDSVVIGSGSNDTVIIKIKINQNNTNEARSVGFIINAQIDSVNVNTVAYIIQDGQPFLYVVPEFKALGSAAGNSGPFNIIHNVSDWTYDPNTIPTDWISNPNVNIDDNTFSFSFIENNDTTSRTATIKIHQQGDTDVYDELTIIQGGSKKYISVIPEFMDVSSDYPFSR